MDITELSFWTSYPQKFKKYSKILQPIFNAILTFSTITFTSYAYCSSNYRNINVEILNINFTFIIAILHTLCLSYSIYYIFNYILNEYYIKKETAKSFECIWHAIKQQGTQNDNNTNLAIKELNGPDEHGFYHRCTPIHAKLIYFETTKNEDETISNINDMVIQAFSLDKENWIHVADVDNYHDEENPLSIFDKMFIKRIHIENLMRDKSYKRSDLNNFSDIKITKDKFKIKNLMERVPKKYLCPLKPVIMKNPVILPNGCTFDRENVMKKINKTGKFEILGSTYSLDDVYPNLHLRELIYQWLEAEEALESGEKEKSSVNDFYEH